MLTETTNLSCQNETLHADSFILLLFRKSNFKVDGSTRFWGTGGTIGLNEENAHFPRT